MSTPSMRQLRAYRAVMSLGSVAKAAEGLSLTQPALSKQISALEETLALKLFERRRGGPMVPTSEGVLFYKSIESTLFGLDAIADTARGIAESGSRRLVIAGTPPILNSRPFSEALMKTSAEFPMLRYALEVRKRIDLESLLVNRQVDVGFGLLTSAHHDLREVVIANTSVVAVMAADHHFSNRKHLKLSDLSSVSVILPTRQPLRDRINSVLPGVSATYEISSSLTGCSLAASGNGVALSDPFSPTIYDQSVLRVVPVRPKISIKYGALIPATSPRNEQLEVLLKHLKTAARSVLD